MKAIKVTDLKKTYITYERGSSFFEAVKSLVIRKPVEVNALKGISFDVDEGELLGFLGPNGAGKSTTLKILAGVLYPTSGAVDVMGYVPWKQRKTYVSRVGAVFGQKSQLIWDIPPIDSFQMNRAIYSISSIEFNKKLAYMIDLLDIGHVIRKPTRQLSLGERMKCEFVMAMLHEPGIVFLDEPTIGLDVIAKDKIRDFILEMNRKGTTFILTTHDLSDVERLARKVIVVNHGEIVFNNTIDALRNNLGAKKVLSITTHKPLPDLSRAGITLTAKHSDFNAELELDVSQYELNEFIDYINKTSVIRDMSVQELSIESVIKDLYMTKV